MSNIYAASEADLSLPEVSDELRMLALTGRIGRVRWIAYTVASWFAVTLLGLVPFAMGAGSDPGIRDMMGYLSVGLMVLATTVVSRRRLQDMGLGIASVVMAFIPFLNFYFLFLMACKRGDEGRNVYGNAPAPNSRSVKIAATVLPSIIVLWMIASVAVPAYLNREARQRANAPDATEWEKYAVPPSELKEPVR